MSQRISPLNEPQQQPVNAFHGEVCLSISKTLWLGGMMLSAIIGGALTLSLENLLVFFTATGLSLCFGHSLGMHRKLIHNSYQCPKYLEYLEYLMVHLGVIVGLAGPIVMIKTHDLRDWSQRQKACHPFLGHQSSFFKDAWWQLFCDLKLEHPPSIKIEASVMDDTVYRFMERTWMWQQFPLGVLLFVLGGLPYVIWGIAARVSVSVFGHWLFCPQPWPSKMAG